MSVLVHVKPHEGSKWSENTNALHAAGIEQKVWMTREEWEALDPKVKEHATLIEDEETVYLITIEEAGSPTEVVGVTGNLFAAKETCQTHAGKELQWNENWYAYGVTHLWAAWDGEDRNYFIDSIGWV